MFVNFCFGVDNIKKYVSELIGEEYKKWKEGDTVIITTPTGSGKTSFVLSKLLQQAVEENMHILYLCNRKVLSEQFREQSKQKLINIKTVHQVYASKVWGWN